MDEAKNKVQLKGRKVDAPFLVNHVEHKEVSIEPEPHTSADN